MAGLFGALGGVEVGKDGVDVAQPRAHPDEQLACQRRIPAHPVEERLALDQLGLDPRCSAHAGAPRLSVEHAHLTDELAGLNLAEHDGIAADLAQHVRAAREDQDREVARIALPEQALAGIELLQHHPLCLTFFFHFGSPARPRR